MKTQEIRKKFLSYFKKQGHALIASSPVLPHDDPTLLFTNAGMNQFKDVFLGRSRRDYLRAASSQKCIRVGGKHNDLENVGHTKRHLTFFEMLGNFSFGDYFKREAMRFAWEVSTEIFQFDPKRLFASVFEEDDEAFELWTEWLPAERIVRMGASDNFWQMGETGPAGPCSELYYDRGEAFGSAKSPLEDAEGERFLEFWNLVFMQYNLQPSGEMPPLPSPSIDTGAGLERVMSLIEGVESVFETDLLRELIAQTEELSGLSYDPRLAQKAAAFRVIADHLRCLAFAVADGAQPGNSDRGYVLRKVLRRAVRYGRTLGFQEPFLAALLPRLVSTMGEDYPELKESRQRIAEILTREEEAFLRTLRRGGGLMTRVIERAQEQGNPISGEEAFTLKDTYGLPIDEILLLAKDAALSVDLPRFEQLEEEAKERSRAARKESLQIAEESALAAFVAKSSPCEFLGYSTLEAEAKVTGLLVEERFVEELKEGQQGAVLLDRTPFYAEKGGQVGDRGRLTAPGSLFEVADCQTPCPGAVLHIGKLSKGSLRVGDLVQASVESERRRRIASNHTATHLLHWALQRVLGEHVRQAGSVVDPERLRFDFNHHKPLSREELQKVEDLVNRKIRENRPIETFEIAYEEAQKKREIKQFFGEKYGSSVRVVKLGESQELCGGTHAERSGSIGLFRIAKESSIAAGVRRIEAVTGARAEQLNRALEAELDKLAELAKTTPQKLPEKLKRLLEERRVLEEELESMKKRARAELIDSLLSKAKRSGPLPFIVEVVESAPQELKPLAEELLARLPGGFILLGQAGETSCLAVARASKEALQAGFSAREAIDQLAPLIQGGGGGRAEAAQAGGKAPGQLKEALDALRERLAG